MASSSRSAFACLLPLLLLALAFVNAALALTANQQAIVLKAHNDYRTALGLNALTWNADAGDFAQGYVEGCPSGHSGNKQYGENLYWYGGVGDAETQLAAAVRGWYEEEPNWSCQNNDCASGQMCGHYTQVMWAATSSVGCGFVNNCTSWPTIVSCNYLQPGNYIGERPFPLTKCSGYPYFNDKHFVLTVTLNTTAAAYSESTFQENLSDTLDLGDENRVVVLSSKTLSSDQTEVQVYIVTVGSSSGENEAKNLIALVQKQDPSLAKNGLYATDASLPSDGSGASALASWVNALL